MNTMAVILAGGGGTRFWPVSRQNKPKQLLNLSGKDIMLNDTIRRYETVIPHKNTMIVTNKLQADILDEILLEDIPRENILKEPVGRNTAACILYAALVIKKRYNDALMVILPSDHYVSNIDCFREVLCKTCEVASETCKLITIGIKPTFPSTGYGYINYNEKVNMNLPKNTYKANEFVEKPHFEKAKEYLGSGVYLWNSGIFVWKASIIMENFLRFLPRMYNKMMEIYDYIDSEKEEEYISKVYPILQSISIDYGILERSDDVLVVPADFGWNDVGSWDTLGEIIPPDNKGNIVRANHVGIDSQNSVVYSSDGERLITTVGIDNLIIADTSDAILVCQRSRAQDVKNLIELLKEREMTKYI